MSALEARTARQAGTVQGIVLLVPVTLATMGGVLLAPILPQLQHAFAGVPGMGFLTQMVLTVPSLCLALFAAPAGYLADRVGRRRMLMAAMVLYAIVGVAPVVLDNLYAIVASRACVGLTEAVILVTSTTMIGDYFSGDTRDKWLSFQTGLASFSAVFLFAISGALAGAFGWRGPFGMYGLSLLMLAGVALFTWEPQSDSAPAVHAAAERGKLAFPLRPLLGICGLTVFASTGFFLLQIEFATALVAKHVADPAAIGGLTAAVSVAVPLGSVVFRYGMNRLLVGTQLAVAFGLMGVGLMLAGQAPNVPVLLAGGMINLLGGGIALPVTLTWAMRLLAFEQRGRGAGMWSACFEVGQFLSSMVAAVVAPAVGGLLPAFVVVGAVCTLVAGGCVVVRVMGKARPGALPLDPVAR